MRTNESHSPFLVLLILSAVEVVLASGSTSCNPAVLRLYGWCEQWACTDNCTCVERQDCHQYCGGHTCRDMRCLSPSICKQKVHLNGRVRPHVLNMFARAPLVTQDCSGGTCDVMRAKGPKLNKRRRKQKRRAGRRKDGGRKTRSVVGNPQESSSTAVLQNCVGGVCKRLISTLKNSKQFCSHCEKMHCFGTQARNCTQICAAGHCKQVQCDARDCQQACLQNSTCNLKCGKNVDTCLQVCELGSTCRMSCEAKKCTQACGKNKQCEIVNVSTEKEMKTSTEKLSTTLKTTPKTRRSTYHSYTKDIYNARAKSSTKTRKESTETFSTTKTTTATTSATTTTRAAPRTTMTTSATSTAFHELLKSTLSNNSARENEENARTNITNKVEDLKDSSITNSSSQRREENSAKKLQLFDLRMLIISILAVLLPIIL